MAWVKLDDGFADHPKIAKVGAFGAWLQIQALCYANRNLTDGFIPWSVARALAGHGVEMTDGKDRVWHLAQTCGMTGRDLEETDWPALLVEVGMWEVAPGGYRIHDYDQYQPSKAQVLAERAATRRRVARFRQRSHGVKAGNAVSNAVGNTAPVPVPLKEEQPKTGFPNPDRTRRTQTEGFVFRGPTVEGTRRYLKRLAEP